jgi:hypothetical protein
MMAKRFMIAASIAGALMAVPLQAAPADHGWLEGVWKARGDGMLHPIDGKPAPLKPAVAKVWGMQKAAFMAGDPKLDLSRRCKPPGEPRLMADPKTPFSVVVTGPRILFAYQWNRLVRMIEMGPHREVIGPTYFGQNAGHWEGSTLVVDVQGLNSNVALDASGLPHGEKARLTERISARGKNQMQVLISINDPQMYSSPWTARLVFDRQPGLTVAEDICLDRENLVGKLADPVKSAN